MELNNISLLDALVFDIRETPKFGRISTIVDYKRKAGYLASARPLFETCYSP